MMGCSPIPEEAHYIRAVVDTDLVSPTEIDAFTVSVERSGTTKFEQSYDATALAQLPDSLVIEEPDPVFVSPDNEYQLPKIRISVTGYANGAPVVWRSASFRYGNGRKQVPLPLCHDCLSKSCPSGETCRHGACVDDSITPEREDEGGAIVDALSQCGPR
jgi:hypothetical protein